MLALVCLLCRVVMGLTMFIIKVSISKVHLFFPENSQIAVSIHFSYIHNLLKIINIKNIYHIPTCGCQITEIENIKEEMPDKVTMHCKFIKSQMAIHKRLNHVYNLKYIYALTITSFSQYLLYPMYSTTFTKYQTILVTFKQYFVALT